MTDPTTGELPAVHRVPASRASMAQNRYRFTMPNDETKVYDVPLLKFLKPALILQADVLSEAAFTRLLFETYLPEVFELFEDSEQVEDFMNGWQEASGISTGESEASPTS